MKTINWYSGDMSSAAGTVSCAFNANRREDQRPWKRAALIAQAESEFRRLRSLKPAARCE